MGKRSDTRYFGKVCGKHPELGGLRWQSGHCSLCLRERARKWRTENPEKHNTKNLRHQKSAKGSATHRKHVAANRAVRRAAGVRLTVVDKQRIASVYAEAQRLTRETGELYHVDHDRPLARGGKHHPDNLIVVPAKFNLKKGARYGSMWDFISS